MRSWEWKGYDVENALLSTEHFPNVTANQLAMILAWEKTNETINIAAPHSCFQIDPCLSKYC